MRREAAYQQFRGVLEDARVACALLDRLKEEWKKPEGEQDEDQQLLLLHCMKYTLATTIKGAQEASEVVWDDEERTNTGQDEYWAPRYDCCTGGDDPLCRRSAWLGRARHGVAGRGEVRLCKAGLGSARRG